MLVMNGSNVNFNGYSTIEDITVASFSANYSGAGVYFNYNIEDVKSYTEHAEDIDADFDGFKTKVLTSISVM